MKNKLIILGNGTSRLKYEDYINDFDGDVWGANRVFEEPSINKKLNLIGTVHLNFAEKALLYKNLHNMNYDIFYSQPDMRFKIFENYKGFSTGSELLNKALIEGYNHIELIGFDSLQGNNSDIYFTQVSIKNFISQVNLILSWFNIKGVNFKSEIVLIKR